MNIWLGHLATLRDNHYGIIENGAIAVENGKIIWLGAQSDARPYLEKASHIHDMRQNWITPALIDCHTHLVYGGNRSHEFEARLNGASYSDIAQAGGGILSTVRATRNASEDALIESALPRLHTLKNEGVGTLEIKSGYGLTLESERKMLRVARALAQDTGLTICTTYLAAHAVPPEYSGQADAYIDAVCDWLPQLHAEGLVDAVDGFCEHIAFSPAQIARVFDAAQALGLPVKLHAEQLSNLEGSALVARYNGLSADHIEYLSQAGIAAMAAAGTVGVLLPGAFYTLRETQMPPVQALRDAGVPIALSTDSNPGTSPLTSLLLTLNMGCTLFGLTPQEALLGVTANAARALGLQHRKGQLAVGYDADLAIWHIDRPADLAYRIGFNPLRQLILAGSPAVQR